LIVPLSARVPARDADGERRATLDLQVSLPDGAVTLLGSAVVALD